jgi:hypothetical protein
LGVTSIGYNTATYRLAHKSVNWLVGGKRKEKEKKGKISIKNYVMKTYESGGTDPPFLFSALEGGEWLASRPCRYTPGDIATGGRVSPRADLSVVEKIKVFLVLGFDPRPVSKIVIKIMSQISLLLFT